MRRIALFPLVFLVASISLNAQSIYQVNVPLIDENANQETVALYDFLKESYGKYVLSGQMDLTWADHVDMQQRVFEKTGKYPAIMGYDFMNYHRGNLDEGSGLHQVEEAIEWHKKGGIVTFCWHWRDPTQETIAFYSRDTEFRIDLEDEQVKSLLMADIDSVAKELKVLEEAGVPVLWRPMHEASGGWFWWGGAGPQPFIDLWKVMVDRLNNHHNIHNLIWVYNGQHPEWYPGDEYIDIISEDVYALVYGDTLPDFGSQWKRFYEAAVTPSSNRIVSLSENGIIPDVDRMKIDNALWSWFMVWNDGPNPDSDRNFFSGEYYNPKYHTDNVFNHPLILTLDDLKNSKLRQE